MLTNHPLVISGPSGVGKTYLTNYLIKNYPFKLVLSTMTRQPRPGEVHMVDNEFLSEEEYKKVEDSGDFFMSVEFFGAKYGYRKSFVENIKKEGFIPIAILFTPVVELFYREYPESFGIYLLPTSADLLTKRMKQRGENKETIEKRLSSMQNEIEFYETKAKQFYAQCFKISRDEDIEEVVEAVTKHYEYVLSTASK